MSELLKFSILKYFFILVFVVGKWLIIDVFILVIKKIIYVLRVVLDI